MLWVTGAVWDASVGPRDVVGMCKDKRESGGSVKGGSPMSERRLAKVYCTAYFFYIFSFSDSQYSYVTFSMLLFFT